MFKFQKFSFSLQSSMIYFTMKLMLTNWRFTVCNTWQMETVINFNLKLVCTYRNSNTSCTDRKFSFQYVILSTMVSTALPRVTAVWEQKGVTAWQDAYASRDGVAQNAPSIKMSARMLTDVRVVTRCALTHPARTCVAARSGLKKWMQPALVWCWCSLNKWNGSLFLLSYI